MATISLQDRPELAGRRTPLELPPAGAPSLVARPAAAPSDERPFGPLNGGGPAGGGREGGDFCRQVRDALRNLYDPVYLQTHPLTRWVRQEAPGGAGANGARASGVTEGAALSRCLLEAIEALRPPGKEASGNADGRGSRWRRYRLLVLRYVEGQEIEAVSAQLAVSRREYERQHRQGLEAVVSLLGTRWGVAGPGHGPDAPHAPHAPYASLAPHPAPGSAPGGPGGPAGAAGIAWGVPRPLTSLVGRTEEIEAVTRLLREEPGEPSGPRLLSLTGPAGVGKTRLALEVAARIGASDGAGTVFVPLAAVDDPGLVPAAIARALGVREPVALGASHLVRSVGDSLRDRRLLLVLDNFEHLLEAGPVVLDLLATCERLTVLVTSREALRLSGEQEYPVPALAVPEESQAQTLPPTIAVEVFERAPAVRLFVERARAISPAFALTPETAPTVAALCRRLDGLPLAIELAAAGVRLFTPAALLARLESATGGLPLLTGGPRDAPPRHQTLRAAIAWSYDLLAPEEQALLRRLAVFAGGFGLDGAAATAWAGADGATAGSDGRMLGVGTLGVVEALRSLVAKSLVRRAEDAPGEPRFGMLETIRDYALERLEASGEADAVRERHARLYYPLIDTGDAGRDCRWLDTVEREHGNMRAAMRWCMAQGDAAHAERGLRLAAALARLWGRRGQLSQGLAELTWALAWPEPAEPGPEYLWVRATVMEKVGFLARTRGDYAVSRRHFEAALALRRQTEQRAMLAFSLCSLGHLAFDQGDFPTARDCYGEATALWREPQRRYRCTSLDGLGRVALEEGDEVAARAYFDEALALARGFSAPEAVAAIHDSLGRLLWLQGDLVGAAAHHEAALILARELRFKGEIAASLDHLGRVAFDQGDAAGAGRRHGAALSLAWEFGDQLRVAWCLEGLAAVAATQKRGRRAARLLGAAAALRGAIGAPLPPSQRPPYERHLAAVRAGLPDETFTAAWDEGYATPLEEVVAFALAGE